MRVKLRRPPNITSHNPIALEKIRRDLEAIDPKLNLRISGRARRLALRLDTKAGAMNLVIPPRASLKKAIEFAHANQDWIRSQTSRLPDRVSLKDGAVIPMLGQDRRICITLNQDLKRTSIELKEKEIHVLTNLENPTPRIMRWLKKQVHEELTRIATEKARIVNKPIAKLQVRDTTSRWGSCSSHGTLSFSWRIIFAPPVVMDYLVAHEVAHLVHMNHSPRFWALCEKLSTDLSTGRKWLRDHGHSLMQYG